MQGNLGMNVKNPNMRNQETYFDDRMINTAGTLGGFDQKNILQGVGNSASGIGPPPYTF
jgi:hypothetical protein